MEGRAKFMLQEHVQTGWSFDHKQHTFVLRPQYDTAIPEDQRFAKATPTGELRLVVDNPKVVESWSRKLGQLFYLDFTPVPAEPPQG